MKYLWTIIVIILVVAGLYIFVWSDSDVSINRDEDEVVATDDGSTSTPSTDDDEAASSVGEREPIEVIGKSVEDRDITAYHFGSGETEVLFVGGIHGGYSWNTVLLSYELIDHLEANPSAVPEGLTVTVIPVLNPDGLASTVGTDGRFSKADVPSAGQTIPGRFNASGVDLNRNFDCNWQSTGVWRDRSVKTGSGAFSEPESQALRDYVNSASIDAAVLYYSAAGGVYASSCNDEIMAETRSLLNTYSSAAGYPAQESFDYYKISGDAVDWLAKLDIPAVSVVLTDHQNTEWSKNKRGIEAVIRNYAN